MMDCGKVVRLPQARGTSTGFMIRYFWCTRGVPACGLSINLTAQRDTWYSVHMPRTRRRIVKWTVLTVVGMLLLTTLYVLGFGATQWYLGSDETLVGPGFVSGPGSSGSIDQYVARRFDAVLYAPLHRYTLTEWPGAQFLLTFEVWCFLNGYYDEYITWEEMAEYVDGLVEPISNSSELPD